MKYVRGLPVTFNNLYSRDYRTIFLILYLYFFVAWNPSILFIISVRIIRGTAVGEGRVVQPPGRPSPRGGNMGRKLNILIDTKFDYLCSTSFKRAK
jgi:hypothetical protein